ncbi:MAG: hypothetical protein J5927_01405, partial [Oscillospiraceae bacterium]|nr:hypothetical protein [Oscillospiraceae bacterium]
IRPLSDLGGGDPPVAGSGAAASAAGQSAPARKLWVRLPSRFDPAMKRIEKLLVMFPGQQQLVLWCEREQKRFGARCLIHEGLILELKEMLGEENVVLR